jgi:hypothetical protein
MKIREIRSFFVFLAMCVTIYTPNLFAQGSDLGTIRGVVADSSGALIPNAQVTITNLSNLRVYSFNTDASGDYDAPNLIPGQYKAAFAAPGFETSVINGIVLNGSDVSQQNAVLHLATETVSVQVTSEAVGINMDNSTLSQTLNPTAVIELPRDSRDINQFLYIDPSVTQGAGSGAPPLNLSTFKPVGGQSYGFSFSLDGQRNSGGVFDQQTKSQPSLESVGELNVLSNNFSAEYAGILNVRVNTKSGGVQNHGSVFYNDVNSGLAAAPMSGSGVAKAHSNFTQVGGSWGGPIPKLKKTFFFMAYEFWDSAAPIPETNNTGVMSPKVQAGDFSEVNLCNDPTLASIVADTPGNVTPAGVTTGTCNGTTVVTGVPSAAQNALTSKLVSLYFPSNIPDNGVGPGGNQINAATGLLNAYSTTLPGSDITHMGDLRIDHDFNDSNRIYAVYHGSAENDATSPVSFPYTGLGLNHFVRSNSVLSSSYTHVFTPHLVNEARGGYNNQNLSYKDNTTVSSFLSSIGMSPTDIAAYGAIIGSGSMGLYGNPVIEFCLSGVCPATMGDGARISDRDLTQHLLTFGDTVSWQKGRHALKFGADFVRNEAVDGFASLRGTPQSTLEYNGTNLTGYTNFLLGNAPYKAAYVPEPRPAMDVSNWETAYYAQDDFRVNTRLTLNLGMRYDLYTPYVDKNDIMANFDPYYRNASTGQVGRYVLASAKTLNYLQPTELSLPPTGIGYVLASQSGLGVGRGLVRPDRFDYGPRFGWAYHIGDKQVFRGGVGVFYPTSSAHQIRDTLSTNTFNIQATYKNQAGYRIDPWPTSSTDTSGTTPVTGGKLNQFNNFPTANWVAVGVKNPRLMQWNATFEQQLAWQTTVRISYIGSAQKGMIMGNDLDMINASDNPFGTTQGDDNYNGLVPLPSSDLYTACDPYNASGSCAYSYADDARITFPMLGDFVTGVGNHGKSMTNSLQVQAERKAKSLTFSTSYTYLDQKTSAGDAGGGSIGTGNYNPFNTRYDYTRDYYVSTHRVVAYAVYDLPFGHGQHYAAAANKLTDAMIGGWQVTTNMFAKSGIGFTPNWYCGDCDPTMAGNIASGAEDAVGDGGPQYRANIVNNPYAGQNKLHQFAAEPTDGFGNPTATAAFQPPDLGSTYWTNPAVARRGALTGPSTWGVNLGLHKAFHINERVSVKIGADFDNVFNHALLSPSGDIGGVPTLDTFANVGTLYNLTPASVDGVSNGTNLAPGVGSPGGPSQPALQPFTSIGPGINGGSSSAIQYNPAFGLKNVSYGQEGITGNRQIRLIARITF